MSGNPRRLLAAASVPAAVAALVLAGPGAAGASTGPRYASAEQVGYAATGAQFKDVLGVVYLRNPAQYAGAAGQYSHSVQLWSSGYVVVAGVSASTSGSGYTPYAKVFDSSTHQLVASDPGAKWCDDHTFGCVRKIGSFTASEGLLMDVSYDPTRGFVYFRAADLDDELYMQASYQVGTGESFTQARIGTEFGPDPWTAPSSYTHPAQWTKIAAYSRVGVQTYNGKTSTLSSWFVHHKIFMSSITGSLIDEQAAPTDLTDGGASFQDRLAPAGVNGPAQPPRG
jgi:hypothetical protein